jgi:transposase
MGARLRVFLTKEQDAELFNLRTAEIPQKVKDRAEVIRLNAAGWFVEKIADHFHWGEKTVRQVLHKWNKQGRQRLWELPGRGVQPKLKEVDIEYLERKMLKGRTKNL